MPYVFLSDRPRLCLSGPTAQYPGELNYQLSQLIHQYILKHGISYTILNEVIGVLECCKLELYRQVIAPYEDVKKRDSGPVSSLDEENK